MNEESVRILKDAMEPPSWWTNGARLSAREVAARLEEHGYTIVRQADATAIESTAAPAAPVATPASISPAAPVAAATAEPATGEASPSERAASDPLASLMANLEAAVEGVRQSHRADSEKSADDERKTA